MFFAASTLSVNYGSVRALADITMNVERGEIVALIGANGAGKSTMLRTICGLNRPWQGSLVFDGRTLETMAPDAIVRFGIAMVPEGRRVFPFMSVKDNLLMGGFTCRDRGELATRIEAALTRFPRLRERYSQDAGTLSGGEQQMLVISRALMSNPRLLLLDEPSLGIAPKLVQDIARAIVAINRDDGTTIILVEQNSRMALRISHRAYALSLGRIALSGESAKLREDDRIKALYLGGEL